MAFDPSRHHRRSVRLGGYDYTSAGGYFLTMCIERKRLLLGEVYDGKMVPNGAGQMVSQWWLKLANKFPTITLDAFVVMPNHLHGVVILSPVGAHLSVRPSLSQIVRWFKTMTTNAYLRGVKQSGWLALPGRMWQRNYYEHVIRRERTLGLIRRYIAENPVRWNNDVENPFATGKAPDKIQSVLTEDTNPQSKRAHT